MASSCCMGLVWSGKRARNMLEGIKEGFRPDSFFFFFFFFLWCFDFGLLLLHGEFFDGPFLTADTFDVCGGVFCFVAFLLFVFLFWNTLGLFVGSE